MGSNAGTLTKGNNNVAIGLNAGQAVEANDTISIGNTAKAEANFAIAIGKDSMATKANATALGGGAHALGAASLALGNAANTQAFQSVAIGTGATTYENANRAMAIGAASSARHANSVALGASATAEAVGTIEATVNGVTYGNFAGTTPFATVSVGNDNLKRTITNVVAGRITETSTDAINGSQLYMVAKGTLDQMPVVYTDQDGNKVVKQPDGTFINPETGEKVEPNNVIASMNNGDNSTTNPMTLTNIKSNLAPVTTATTEQPNANHPVLLEENANNAATLGDVLNAGWNLQGNGEAKDVVVHADTVNFVNGAGTTAVVDTDGKTSTVKYDVNVDGDTITTKTDPNDPTKTVITANTTPLTNTDGKVNTPVAPTVLVTAQTVANAINNSGWKLAAEGTEGTELISPSDTATFKVGSSNLTVKRENSDITYDLAKDINVNSVQFNENGPKITNDRDNIKVGDKDGNPTKITNVADGDISPVSTDVINGKQLNNYAKVNGQNVNTTPDRSINIVNGKGTTVSTNQEGEIAVNIGETGLTVSNGSQTNANGSIAADGTLVVQDPNGSGANFVNATNLAKAVNNVSWKVDSEKDETTANAATKNTYTADNNKVKAGDTVKVNAGRNVEISGSGKNINVAVSDNPEFDTVKVGKGDNATTISSNQEGLRVAKADGSAQRITNVRAGVADTDAVNVSQLKGAVNHLDNKINRNNRNLRAGIAGANAAAGLPQVYIPGKSMVAASAGTFKGESALAVGYSRASDNGKVILKLQGNANTRGDVGGSVGVGYQW
ncbi:MULTISPECIES: YadA family autotransporter adhesin [unclassified Mannheimia]|uniref:YadA family autotransporter adhesin n=1 Tax=unclassified Mannheimia TaxID=2645054 RepID=UPI00359D9991